MGSKGYFDPMTERVSVKVLRIHVLAKMSINWDKSGLAAFQVRLYDDAACISRDAGSKCKTESGSGERVFGSKWT